MAKEETEVLGIVDPFAELELIDLARRREDLGRMTIGQIRKAHEERYASITVPGFQNLPLSMYVLGEPVHGNDGKSPEQS